MAWHESYHLIIFLSFISLSFTFLLVELFPGPSYFSSRRASLGVISWTNHTESITSRPLSRRTSLHNLNQNYSLNESPIYDRTLLVPLKAKVHSNINFEKIQIGKDASKKQNSLNFPPFSNTTPRPIIKTTHLNKTTVKNQIASMGVPLPSNKTFKASSNGSTSSRRSEEEELLAACFVGGLRSFEITGPTIIHHLLHFYKPHAIFFNIPLDKDAHKVSLLFDSSSLPPFSSNFVINVVSQKPMQENGHAKRFLTSAGSPNKILGLLQYFDLVEGCVGLINKFQEKHNVNFTHILRTRPDSFWNSEPPPLSSLPNRTFITPRGSMFGGLNDRFSISDYQTGIVGLKRLSILKVMARSGYRFRPMNSEECLKTQLNLYRVKHQSMDVPFCVLSKRRYPWPPGKSGIPVLSITSKGMMNGAKCRPCIPITRGNESRSYLQEQGLFWSRVGTDMDMDVCNASANWSLGWENVVDEVTGTVATKIRKKYSFPSYRTCMQDHMALNQSGVVYKGPPLQVLCALGLWGNHEPIGVKHQNWMVLTKDLSPSSVVYSFGIKRNMSWETDLTTRFGCVTHSFDCTPFGYSWVESNLNLSKNVYVHNTCLGFREGFQIFNEIGRWYGDVQGYSSYAKTLKKVAVIGKVVLAKSQNLEKMMKTLNHKAVDVVRVDLGLDFLAICLGSWSKSHASLPICQLIVSFDIFGLGVGISYKLKCFDVLSNRGLHLTKCFGSYGSEKCHFLSSSHCKF